MNFNFQQNNQTPNNQQNKNPFAQSTNPFENAKQGSIFGQQTGQTQFPTLGQNTTQTTGGIFNQQTAQPQFSTSVQLGQNTAQPSTNVFGQSSISTPLQGQNLPQPSTGIFGQTQQAQPSANIFGQTQPTSNVFGQTQQAQPSTDVFGQSQQAQHSENSFRQAQPFTNAFRQTQQAQTSAGVFGQAQQNVNMPGQNVLQQGSASFDTFQQPRSIELIEQGGNLEMKSTVPSTQGQDISKTDKSRNETFDSLISGVIDKSSINQNKTSIFGDEGKLGNIEKSTSFVQMTLYEIVQDQMSKLESNISNFNKKAKEIYEEDEKLLRSLTNYKVICDILQKEEIRLNELDENIEFFDKLLQDYNKSIVTGEDDDEFVTCVKEFERAADDFYMKVEENGDKEDDILGLLKVNLNLCNVIDSKLDMYESYK